MNSSLAVDPQPRYVFLTGGMNPGESSLILPFNNCEVFPRERTIRLELLEFELCSDNTHPHFSDSPKIPFPPADQPYQPVISVVRPAPLPATKRRRTNYYIPPTFKTGQWPYAATLDYPSGKRQKRKKKKKKQQPAPEEEEERGRESEGSYETVFEEEEDERVDEEEAARLRAMMEEDEGWLVSEGEMELEPPRKRFRRAGFKESKVKLSMAFKTNSGSMAKPLTYSASVTTFYKLVEQLNKRLVDFEGRVFCNLHEHGPAVFAFVNSEGTPQPAQSRQKLRIRLTLPPRTKVLIDPGAIFKMLGLREAGLKPYPKWGDNAQMLSNNHDSEPRDFFGTTELTPTSYIMAAKGLTDQELSLIESFRLGVSIDLSRVTLSWDTDHTKVSSPLLSPQSKASLFLLNQMVALGMELLLLNSTSLELKESAAGQLICPKAEFVKPVPSAVSRDLESTFSITLEFGPKAAKDLGLAARISPLFIEGGKLFRAVDNAFLRSAGTTETFNAQSDGGGLNWTQYIHYLSNTLVTDAHDDVSDINAQLDSRKKEVLEQGPVLKPSWATLEPAAREPTPPPRAEESPERAEEAATAGEVIRDLAAGGEGAVEESPVGLARDIAQEVQQERNQEQPAATIDDRFQGPPAEVEGTAPEVLAEQEGETSPAHPLNPESEGAPLPEEGDPAPAEEKRKEGDQDPIVPRETEGRQEEAPGTLQEEQPPDVAPADADDETPPPLEAATPPPQLSPADLEEEEVEAAKTERAQIPPAAAAEAAAAEHGREEELEGEGGNQDDPDWLPFFEKWYKTIGISRELREEIKKYKESSETLRKGEGYHWWTHEWVGWDAYVRDTLPKNPDLQRALLPGEPGTKDYRVVSEAEPMAQLVDPEPVRIPTPPVVNFAALMTAYESRQPQQSTEGAFGDEEEENLRQNPWETHRVPNPIPKPPDTFTPWSTWPIPTCPEESSLRHPLPDFIMLLCPDGIRRDYVGAFGMDSLLAKVRHRRHLVFRNYCIIRNPGRLSQLVFEVVDHGFNRIKNTLTHPLFIRMGFRYSTLANETEVASYV
jgi:hypothetical protein